MAMTSQLSEAKKRERAFMNRGRRNQLRSMGEAKNLLQFFNICSIQSQMLGALFDINLFFSLLSED
ncbi:hypothetical protein Ahy_B06g080901 [Arachis hypogaea]|uniref:Uncharacterized protein n=1 Tax=Arachis hypogaea TaxID=3818 RepID=A0A444YJD8_ARAHY|nr:hypothetical protein Ahy_B06g080901 [Arachis hypogaea]